MGLSQVWQPEGHVTSGVCILVRVSEVGERWLLCSFAEILSTYWRMQAKQPVESQLCHGMYCQVVMLLVSLYLLELFTLTDCT